MLQLFTIVFLAQTPHVLQYFITIDLHFNRTMEISTIHEQQKQYCLNCNEYGSYYWPTEIAGDSAENHVRMTAARSEGDR
uniref:Putative secreted protein n=1 Tax=Anopheles triannulatus TaxID=58253 RepID=A0A2M4B4Q4_9DIPT